MNRDPSLRRGTETFAGIHGRLTIDLRQARVGEKLVDIVRRREANNGYSKDESLREVTKSVLLTRPSARKPNGGNGKI